MTITSNAQLYVKGNLDVTNSAAIYVNGGVYGSGAGQITNNGDINVTVGDWDNDVAITFLDGVGETTFSSSSAQNINGTSSTSFYNLTINNSGIGIRLFSNISVANTMQMTDGDFDLQDYIVDLETTGSINGETETNRIKVGNPATNTGTIQTTKNISSVTGYNPANLGLKISTNQNLGDRTIVRGHQIQMGSGTFTTSGSVERYFDIPGIGELDGTNVNIEMYYWDAELNGHTGTDLVQFQWVQEGGTSQWWTPLDGTINANLSTPSASPYGAYFTTSTWYGFTYHDRFTLGSSTIPLSVELAQFTTECNNNIIEINWTTTSEINNDYFILEKSTNGNAFEEINRVQGAGNSNSIQNYKCFDNDLNSEYIYYRLRQVDFDGNFILSNTINAKKCKSEIYNSGIINF